MRHTQFTKDNTTPANSTQGAFEEAKQEREIRNSTVHDRHEVYDAFGRIGGLALYSRRYRRHGFPKSTSVFPHFPYTRGIHTNMYRAEFWHRCVNLQGSVHPKIRTDVSNTLWNTVKQGFPRRSICRTLMGGRDADDPWSERGGRHLWGFDKFAGRYGGSVRRNSAGRKF